MAQAVHVPPLSPSAVAFGNEVEAVHVRHLLVGSVSSERKIFLAVAADVGPSK